MVNNLIFSNLSYVNILLIIIVIYVFWIFFIKNHFDTATTVSTAATTTTKDNNSENEQNFNSSVVSNNKQNNKQNLYKIGNKKKKVKFSKLNKIRRYRPNEYIFDDKYYYDQNIIDRHDNFKSDDDIIDDVISKNNTYESSVLFKYKLNPNFLRIQFHNDYRDVLTALNNLVPDKKQLFNLPNEPLVYSEPGIREVKDLVSDFVDKLNENLIMEVPNYRNQNSGWDEAIPDPTVESGWNKIQNSLGLPTSLYDDPAKKAKVVLIAIKYVQKYETEDEIKYSIDIVLQKVNVEDQIILKCDFVQDKRPLRDENNFFRTTNVEMNIVTENIYVTGYLTSYGDNYDKYDGLGIGDHDDKYYDYNKMEYNNMTDPKYIQKILMEKYRQRSEEMEQRNALLDEEGQAFHKDLPHIYDYSNIRGTQTIFDDMNHHKQFD